MRVKNSVASSRAESFLAARASRTEEIVHESDIYDLSYTARHDISCPYSLSHYMLPKTARFRKRPLQIQNPETPARCRRYKMLALSAQSLSGRGKTAARDRARALGRRRRRCCGRECLRGGWRRRFGRR